MNIKISDDMSNKEICELISYCLIEYDKNISEQPIPTYASRVNQKTICSHKDIGICLEVSIIHSDNSVCSYWLNDFDLIEVSDDYSYKEDVKRFMILKYQEEYLLHLKNKLEIETQNQLTELINFSTNTPETSMESLMDAKVTVMNLNQLK
jgi:hypothetical protein